MKISAKLNKENQLELSINNKLVRTVTPRNGKAYKFSYNEEECFFIYEEKRVMRHINKRVYLYPINVFQPNNIIEL